MTPYRQWRARFAEALDERFYSIDYLDQRVEIRGDAQLWPGVNAAIVTAFRQFPNCMAIEGLVAAGDLDEIVGSLIPAAEAWGKANGCRFALIESRPGWQRMLRGRGFEPHQVALRKML